MSPVVENVFSGALTKVKESVNKGLTLTLTYFVRNIATIE